MALDNQLSSFMPHTVTITSFSSKNNYGENTFSGSRTARAYVEPGKNLDQSIQTNDEHVGTTAYIADTNISIRDSITLADNTTPNIMSVTVHTEVVGMEHTMVVFA